MAYAWDNGDFGVEDASRTPSGAAVHCARCGEVQCLVMRAGEFLCRSYVETGECPPRIDVERYQRELEELLLRDEVKRALRAAARQNAVPSVGLMGQLPQAVRRNRAGR